MLPQGEPGVTSKAAQWGCGSFDEVRERVSGDCTFKNTLCYKPLFGLLGERDPPRKKQIKPSGFERANRGGNSAEATCIAAPKLY